MQTDLKGCYDPCFCIFSPGFFNTANELFLLLTMQSIFQMYQSWIHRTCSTNHSLFICYKAPYTDIFPSPDMIKNFCIFDTNFRSSPFLNIPIRYDLMFRRYHQHSVHYLIASYGMPNRQAMMGNALQVGSQTIPSAQTFWVSISEEVACEKGVVK